jgi:hypothetical protein
MKNPKRKAHPAGPFGPAPWLGGLLLKCFLEIHIVLLKCLNALLVGFALCCLMVGDCIGNQVPTAGQQQSENGQSKGGQTAAGSVTHTNSASSGGISTKSRNAFESLKAMLAHKAPIRATIAINALSGFVLGYAFCKWRIGKSIRGIAPNTRTEPPPQATVLTT